MNLLQNTSIMKSKKKLLFYNHTSLVSGAEISLLEMLSELKDEEFILACPRGKLSELAIKRGINWVKAPSLDIGFKKNPYYILLFTVQFIRACLWVLIFSKKWRVDLIYANTIRAGIASIPSFIFGIPTIVHIRDILPEGLFTKLTSYLLVRFSSALVFNSEFTREKFGIKDKKRTEVIYSPVGYRFFKFIDSKSAKKTMGIEKRFPVISVIGQIAPWKRIELAINAVKVIKNKYPDVILLIVGDVVFKGRKRRLPNELYFERIKEMVLKEKIEKNVVFMGSREDVEVIMNASDLVVFTSHNEPFGRVIGEAMACGVPVLVPEESGIGRIIKGKNCGWWFSKEEEIPEKILSILGDENLKEKIINEILLSWALFSPAEILDKIKKLINELAG